MEYYIEELPPAYDVYPRVRINGEYWRKVCLGSFYDTLFGGHGYEKLPPEILILMTLKYDKRNRVWYTPTDAYEEKFIIDSDYGFIIKEASDMTSVEKRVITEFRDQENNECFMLECKLAVKGDVKILILENNVTEYELQNYKIYEILELKHPFSNTGQCYAY